MSFKKPKIAFLFLPMMKRRPKYLPESMVIDTPRDQRHYFLPQGLLYVGIEKIFLTFAC